MPSGSKKEEDNTIEDVDEDKIDEILRDATKNLVIFFCLFSLFFFCRVAIIYVHLHVSNFLQYAKQYQLMARSGSVFLGHLTVTLLINLAVKHSTQRLMFLELSKNQEKLEM